jgi:hypothetical protein
MAQGELFDSSLCIHTIVDRTFLIVSRTQPQRLQGFWSRGRNLAVRQVRLVKLASAALKKHGPEKLGVVELMRDRGARFNWTLPCVAPKSRGQCR